MKTLFLSLAILVITIGSINAAPTIYVQPRYPQTYNPNCHPNYHYIPNGPGYPNYQPRPYYVQPQPYIYIQPRPYCPQPYQPRPYQAQPNFWFWFSL